MGDVSQVFFEALFVRNAAVTPELSTALRAAGFDRANPQSRYPGATLTACVEVMRRHLFASLEPSLGKRAVGHSFVRGFRSTLLGSVVTAALPIVGARRFLPRLPGRLASVRSDCTATAEVHDHDATLTFIDPEPLGEFFAGVLEEVLVLARAPHRTVTMTPKSDGYVLTLAWK